MFGLQHNPNRKAKTLTFDQHLSAQMMREEPFEIIKTRINSGQ